MEKINRSFYTIIVIFVFLFYLGVTTSFQQLNLAGLESEYGLVAYWKFDEGVGNVAYDSSGNGNDGTIYGAIWVDGIEGKALQFNGIDDYIEIPSSPSLNLIDSQITILAWVKTNYTKRGTIVCNWYYDKSVSPHVNERSYVCTINDDGKADFGLSGDGEVGVFLKSSESINKDKWTHLAFVSNGSIMAIYVDGKLTDTKEAPSTIYQSNREVFIGVWNAKEAAGGEFSEFFKGAIDRVKVYSRALSSQEILQDYFEVVDTGKIEGTVVDEINGSRLSGVKISANGYWNTTNLNGEYTLTLPIGTYTVTALKIGYKQKSIPNIIVQKNQTTTVNFALEPIIGNIVYVATDGTGDFNCDGKDDQIEINEAISYINSIRGGIIHLKQGTYIIRDSIILCSNLTFEGEGVDKTAIKIQEGSTKENWAPIVGNGISSTIIKSLTIDGNKGNCPVPKGINSDVDAFHLYYSNNLLVENVEMVNFWTDGVEFSHSSNSIVRNCKAIQAGHEGLRAIYCNNITFSNNYIYSAGTGNAGIRIYESSYCTIENNYFNVYGFGILINPQGGVPCGNNTYRDNYIEGHYGLPGIALWPWDTEISNETFIRNIIAKTDGSQEDYGHGINLRTRGASLLKDIKIINNVINKAIQSGIYIGDGANVDNIIAKNNIIVNNNEYGIYGNVISSYNDVWNNKKGDYSGGASAGLGDISEDPLFADPENGDFHLKSEYGRWNGSSWVYDNVTSPCIDAGDPSSDYSKEPKPNGGRINMGAYGNAVEASKSPGDTTPPIINNIQQKPEIVPENQPVTVYADITDESGVAEAILSYSTDDGTSWRNTTMSPVNQTTYAGEIPGHPAGTSVIYKLIAIDQVGNTAVNDNAKKYYVYTVVSEILTLTPMFLLIIISMVILLYIKKIRLKKRKNISNLEVNS